MRTWYDHEYMGIVKSSRLALALVLVLVLAALGCGDDGGVIDSGTPDSATDTGVTSSPVDIPWLDEGVPPNLLTPCPEGWREVVRDGVTECDPYPEGGPATCDLGEAHFPGEAACRPVGDACPVGDYATTLPTDGSVVYAKADTPAGGDGSIASPYAGLSEVPWFSLGAGATVALAKGTYEGTLALRAGVQVVGACARDTIITGSPFPIPGVLSVSNAGEAAVVRNLTVADSPQFGAMVDMGRALSLEGVILERTHELGILAAGAGAVVTLTDTVVRDTRARSRDGEFGRGISLQEGARLEATRVLVTGNYDVGIIGFNETTVLTISDSVVRDTHPAAFDGEGGRGLHLRGGAHLDASRLLVDGNSEVGLFVGDLGTRVTLADVIVRDTRSRESDGITGNGVVVLGGAHVDASRLLIAESHEVGLLVHGEGTVVSLVGSVVRGTRPRTVDDRFGRGVVVQNGAHFDAQGLIVDESRDFGIFAMSLGTELTLADTAVLRTQPQASDGANGRGIGIQQEALVDGNRVRIDGAWQLGVVAASDARLELRNVDIANVGNVPCMNDACPEEALGYGAGAASATLRLEGFQIHDTATCGVFLSPLDEFGGVPAVDLRSGTVSMSAIGACVQVEGYDLDRLTTDVAYRDNGTNLDSTMLPVPQAVGAIAP